jgi:peptidoglycan-associated lipoprotein
LRSHLLAVAAATVVLAACSTAPKNAPVAAAPAPAPLASTQPAPAVATPRPQMAARPEYLDPSSEISRRHTVHFGFDDSTIQPKDQSVVELQGRYLAMHPNVSVRVEGNTDERGSSEYNLALGQRRAEATVKALRVFGAKDSQMEATSWGEEKPVAQGHDEAAWAQNRRADVVYPSR